LFGETGDAEIPSIGEWNSSNWKKEYGPLASDLVFIAEDILGDQYGYQYKRDVEAEFVKFRCEGGKVEHIEGGIQSVIDFMVCPDESTLLDLSLVSSAFARGMHPSSDQHLAFRVPLVVGGAYEVGNVSVESIALHLGMLSQLSLKNMTLPEGTPISKFINRDQKE
jgi:hypothetical protein